MRVIWLCILLELHGFMRIGGGFLSDLAVCLWVVPLLAIVVSGGLSLGPEACDCGWTALVRSAQLDLCFMDLGAAPSWC